MSTNHGFFFPQLFVAVRNSAVEGHVECIRNPRYTIETITAMTCNEFVLLGMEASAAL